MERLKEAMNATSRDQQPGITAKVFNAMSHEQARLLGHSLHASEELSKASGLKKCVYIGEGDVVPHLVKSYIR